MQEERRERSNALRLPVDNNKHVLTTAKKTTLNVAPRVDALREKLSTTKARLREAATPAQERRGYLSGPCPNEI